MPFTRDPYEVLSARMITTLAYGSLASALIHGIDYLILPQRDDVLSVAERAAPVQAWGVLLLVATALTFAGRIVHRWPVTIIGHALLAGVFCALGVGALIGGVIDPAGDGFRDGAGYLGVQTCVHLLLTRSAWRRWDSWRG